MTAGTVAVEKASEAIAGVAVALTGTVETAVNKKENQNISDATKLICDCLHDIRKELFNNSLKIQTE